MCFVVSPERSWQALTLSAAGKCKIYSNFTTYVIYMKRWNRLLLSGTTVLKGILLAGGRSPWVPLAVSILSILWMPSACVTVILTSHYFIKAGAGIWCHCHVSAESQHHHNPWSRCKPGVYSDLLIQIINFSMSWCCPHTHTLPLSLTHTLFIRCWYRAVTDQSWRWHSTHVAWITLTHKGARF